MIFGLRKHWNAIDWEELTDAYNRIYHTNFSSAVEMIDKLQKKNSRVALSEIFGVSYHSIAMFCKKNNIKGMTNHRNGGRTYKKLPKDKMICEKCAAWFNENEVFQEKGMFFCRSCLTAMTIIERFAENNNVTIKELTGKSQCHKYCQLRYEIWDYLHEKGYSNGEIGKLFNRSVAVVSRGLNR